MSYIEKKGNIFNTSAMAVVNTVNCVGAMGKGIALDFKMRFPMMFKAYQKICFEHKLHPGQILPYHDDDFLILNFAIKDDWKDPSKVEWIEETLQKFVQNYKRLGVTSVAFPWMGAMNGGLPIEIIKKIMRQYLENIEDVDVEVYDFDPHEPCPLFKALMKIYTENLFTIEELSSMSDIKARYWVKIYDALSTGQVVSINELCHYIVDGKRIIGKTNIERLFLFLTNYRKGKFAVQRRMI